MKENIVVSNRGQITLPAEVRERLGIRPGSVVILEEQEGGVMVRPAAVVEIDVYSNEQIAQWDAEDKLSEEERQALYAKLGGGGE